MKTGNTTTLGTKPFMTRFLNTCFVGLILFLKDSEMLLSGESIKPTENSPGIAAFYADNISNIGDLDSVLAKPRESVVGLRLSDAYPEKWARFGQWYTNVVYLGIETGSDTIPTDVLENCAKFPALKYLQITAPKALVIPSTIGLLTNSGHLQSLLIQAKKATNMSSAIYNISSLEELVLHVGNVCLPDGMSKLSNLRKLILYGKKVRCLPTDLFKTGLVDLDVSTISGIDSLLPQLPSKLETLIAGNCSLRAVPTKWIHHGSLQFLNLNDNQITSMPDDWTGLPNLRLLCIENNSISNVPALKLPKSRELKIRLWDNPIKTISADNDAIISNGILEK